MVAAESIENRKVFIDHPLGLSFRMSWKTTSKPESACGLTCSCVALKVRICFVCLFAFLKVVKKNKDNYVSETICGLQSL